MTSLLPEPVELGGDATFLFAVDAHPSALPSGVSIDHGDHVLVVPWAGVDVVPFTLDSLMPLTVVEQVSCTGCAATGWITAGKWLPSKNGDVT